jgi:hypothetical protein
MKRCLLFAFLLPNFCVSQDTITNNILTTKKFVKGIYVTFREFKENSPSILEDFIIKADTSEFERYELLVPNSKKKFRNVCGFSDGESVFINAQTYEQRAYFVKMLILGKITYFEDARAKTKIIGMNNAAVGHLLGGIIVASILYAEAAKRSVKNPGFVVYMPDDDGRPFILETKTLRSILKEGDPELSKNYQEESDKNNHKVLIKYILEFNRRHHD